MSFKKSLRFFINQRTWSSSKFYESQFEAIKSQISLKTYLWVEGHCCMEVFIINYQYILIYPYIPKECGPWGLK